MVDMSQAAPGVPSLARLIRIGGAWRPWPGSTGTTHSYIQVALMVLMYRNDVNAKQWCNCSMLAILFHSQLSAGVVHFCNSSICKSFIPGIAILETTTSMTLHGQ